MVISFDPSREDRNRVRDYIDYHSTEYTKRLGPKPLARGETQGTEAILPIEFPHGKPPGLVAWHDSVVPDQSIQDKYAREV